MERTGTQMEGCYKIGVDIGGTTIKVGILNEAYEVLKKTAVPTPKENLPESMFDSIAKAVEDVLQLAGIAPEQCKGLGAGCPGVVDSKKGEVRYSNNIRMENVALVKALEERLPFPAYINNDANCAALGEQAAGVAKGCDNIVMFTLGTGVGGGIIINGKIFEGGYAGGAEIGHIVNGAEGRICTCGRKDCLETYASATALIQDALKAAKENPDGKLWELCGRTEAGMNAKIVFDAADAGDAQAQAIIDHYVQHLADGIEDIVNIFRPDAIVLGGGVCAQGKKLTDPIEAYLQENSFGKEKVFIPKVLIAQNGNDAGIIGAAALVE